MAKKFSADYSAVDIMEMYQQRKNDGDEGRFRRLATEFRAMCRIEHEVNIPPQYKAITRDVRTPFVRDAAHRITTSLIAKPPVIHITPKDDKREEYREAANIAERWDTAAIDRMNKDLGEDLAYNSTMSVVRDGESVVKVVHRPQAWANFPRRESEEDATSYNERVDMYKRGVDMPFMWSVVDRMCVVYENGEYGDQWVIEYGEYDQPFLKRRFNMVTDERSGRLINPANTLEGKEFPEGLHPSSANRSVKVEFFTEREWHVLIDGSEAPGFPRKNPYAPYLPYFRAKSYQSESLLYSLLFLVPRLDELLTMKLNWSYLGAYPVPVIESVPNSNSFPGLDGPLGNVGGAGEGKNTLRFEPGKLMQLPLGYTMRFLEPPAVGADLNELVLILKNLIDVAGIPSIMRGMTGGEDSGYHASQLRAAADMAYKQVSLSCQRQFEKATEFTHWLVSNVVKQTVYVLGWESINSKTGKPTEKAEQAWIGLSPDNQGKNIANIKRLGPISYQYRPTLPTDEQARAMIAMQLTNANIPLYGVRKALEIWMQEEDPDSIMDELWVQQALQQEPLKSLMLEKVMQEAGLVPPTPPPAQQEPNPFGGLVDQFGQPMLPPGPGQLQGVPLANQMVQGTPAVPGVTMPIQPGTPQAPQGVPGDTGGRVAGMYPGMPGGPNL